MRDMVGRGNGKVKVRPVGSWHMPDVDEKLTFEVLKKLQQRLYRAEEIICGFEVELVAVREHQISVLKDLYRIYDLLGRQDNRLVDGRAQPNASHHPGDEAEGAGMPNT
jgi:hypothetical protein